MTHRGSLLSTDIQGIESDERVQHHPAGSSTDISQPFRNAMDEAKGCVECAQIGLGKGFFSNR